MGAQGSSGRLGDKVAKVLSPGSGTEPRPSGSQIIIHSASGPNTECGQMRGTILEDTTSDLVIFVIS